ncbi:MAG: glycosyltransferase, partial [Burkholderiales bacterium]|nr:glycosyltransferase [Burkholderiales bacterium]
SLTETFGNVVPEAMASGLAVLAYDQAAAGQLLRHGASGLLAPPGDEAAFCRLARQLAAEPARVPALGRQARLAALGLDWGRIVEAVEAEYAAALAAGGPMPSTRAAPAQAVASQA